jgi:hypothetical protein
MSRASTSICSSRRRLGSARDALRLWATNLSSLSTHFARPKRDTDHYFRITITCVEPLEQAAFRAGRDHRRWPSTKLHDGERRGIASSFLKQALSSTAHRAEFPDSPRRYWQKPNIRETPPRLRSSHSDSIITCRWRDHDGGAAFDNLTVRAYTGISSTAIEFRSV